MIKNAESRLPLGGGRWGNWGQSENSVASNKPMHTVLLI